MSSHRTMSHRLSHLDSQTKLRKEVYIETLACACDLGFTQEFWTLGSLPKCPWSCLINLSRVEPCAMTFFSFMVHFTFVLLSNWHVTFCFFLLHFHLSAKKPRRLQKCCSFWYCSHLNTTQLSQLFGPWAFGFRTQQCPNLLVIQ